MKKVLKILVVISIVILMVGCGSAIQDTIHPEGYYKNEDSGAFIQIEENDSATFYRQNGGAEGEYKLAMYLFPPGGGYSTDMYSIKPEYGKQTLSDDTILELEEGYLILDGVQYDSVPDDNYTNEKRYE